MLLCTKGLEPNTTSLSSSHSCWSKLWEGIVRFRGSICLPPSGISTNILPWVYWQIWTSKSLIVFEDKTLFAEEIALRSITSAREWISAQPIKNTHQTTLLEPRIKRFQGSTNLSSPRVFTDAAWHKESSHAGLWWIFFNEAGEFDRWSEFQLHVNSPLMVEAPACRSSLNHAISLGLRSLQVFSDNQMLIWAINTGILD